MEEWVRRVERVLAGLGFRVSSTRARYRGLFGGVVDETRVLGFSEGVRVVVARLPDGRFRVAVVAHRRAESLAESLESAGFSVDYDEGRVDAVLRVRGVEGVERALRRGLG